MEVSSTQQVFVFLLCVVSGVICGMFFDLQRFLRKICAASNIRTTVEDTVFIILCSAVVIGFGFFFNDGEIRLYQLAGTLSGALFYIAALSRPFMWILNLIRRIVETLVLKPFIKICRILYVPVRKIYSLTRRILKKTAKILRGIRNNAAKHRKRLKKRIKML